MTEVTSSAFHIHITLNMPRSRTRVQRSHYKPFMELCRKQKWERKRLKQAHSSFNEVRCMESSDTEDIESLDTEDIESLVTKEHTSLMYSAPVFKPLVATDIISNWALKEVNVPKSSVSRLLKALQPVLPDLPLSYKSLLPKPNLHFMQMGDGKYVHLHNWMSSLKKLLLYSYRDMQGTVKYNLIINIDGLPLFKHSPDFKIYPILISVYKLRMRPICAGIYCTEKSKNREMPVSEVFLLDLLNDLKDLRSNNIFQGHLCLKFCGNGIFVCDAPARSCLKQIKSHSGYNSCERCQVKGFYDHLSKHACFEPVVRQKRSDENFVVKSHPEHHKGTSALTEFGVNMVTGFVLDYMHLSCLGVMKRLMSYWKGVTRFYNERFCVRQVFERKSIRCCV
uniref:Transposase domain-containing protein n=1 Tax=Phallusia mammillata TaxID=59560 RepID=A0A6F9DFK9_9ASCI|nr:transposase domain-containing protein [Phallusia mammillata]